MADIVPGELPDLALKLADDWKEGVGHRDVVKQHLLGIGLEWRGRGWWYKKKKFEVQL
jgi:hypothetical protein